MFHDGKHKHSSNMSRTFTDRTLELSWMQRQRVVAAGLSVSEGRRRIAEVMSRMKIRPRAQNPRASVGIGTGCGSRAEKVIGVT